MKGIDLNLEIIHEVSLFLNEDTNRPYQFDVLRYFDIKEPTLTELIDWVGVVVFGSK